MKPEYINYKEGTILNKKTRPSYGASICKVEAKEPFFWLIYGDNGTEDYGYCLSIEQAEAKLFELIGSCEFYLDTHQPAEELHGFLINEEQRQKHESLQAKEKAEELYQNALLIAPGITREQYESLIMSAREAGLFAPLAACDDLPF